MTAHRPPRHRLLPAEGPLLVSTDLHGNLEDFERLRALFLEARDRDPRTHWVLLGDLVHGPDDRARADDPALHGFADRSFEIVAGVDELQRRYPGHVHLVLGNHDHGHVGGPHTAKFHPDEVAHLEDQLDEAELALLRGLFGRALLLALAPCGIALCHGAPGDPLRDLTQLERVELEAGRNAPTEAALLQNLLTSYGQTAEVAARLLERLGRSAGFPLSVLVHGHDRDEEGYFVEGGNQLCPVIFGAPRENKRYLRLDLGRRYAGIEDLGEGREILRLYG